MASYCLNDDLFQEDPEEANPSEFNTKNCGQFIDVSKDKLSVKYIGSGTHTNDVGAIQANRPAPTQRLLYYFEVAIRDRGEKGRISVGFTEESFKMSRQPGWEPNSYGYHGDDGKFFNANGQGDTYGPIFTTNDMIGAGINYSTQEIFFTKNGKSLGVACRDVQGQFFPTIGLHSPNERIEANFGKKTFLFDIEAMVREERNKRLQQVEGISVSSSIPHSIVRDYFSFYGYQATLAAIDSTAGGESQQQAVEKSGVSSIQHSGGYCGLDNRKALRQLIRSGDVDTAISKVHEWYPGIIQNDTAGISFLLTSQKFIELIRRGDLVAAVDYGRQMLSGVEIQGLDEGQETHRQNCLALLAYEDPLLSPVSYLLGANQREAVADTVNAAVLMSQEEPQQSVLEKLLRQLTACNGEKRVIEGGQGEVFRLHKVLNESLVGIR